MVARPHLADATNETVAGEIPTHRLDVGSDEPDDREHPHE
jgi:hypothetical protein